MKTMNKNGAYGLGFALLLVWFVIILVAFSLIEPFKTNLNANRGYQSSATNSTQTGLNCPETPTFNSTDYNDDTPTQKLIRRPTCFVTGVSMVWFIGAVLLASTVWLIENWRKPK